MLIVEDRGSLVCYHPWCFEVPSKFRMAPIDFLFYVVQDNDGDILPGELSTLDEMMSSKPVRFRKEGSTMAKIRKEYEGRFLNDEQPISRAAQLLGIYQSKTKDELAQILHYNRQIKMGEREDLMMRILDGAEHGILGKCPQCGSRLGLSHISSSNDDDNEDSFIVVCKGDFFVPKCDYTASTLEAPRVPLWYVVRMCVPCCLSLFVFPSHQHSTVGSPSSRRRSKRTNCIVYWDMIVVTHRFDPEHSSLAQLT